MNAEKQVERLDRTQPPPGYEVRDTSYEDGDDEVGGYDVTIPEWSWIADGYTDCAASRDVCIADAWLHYEEDSDPPGMWVHGREWGVDGLFYDDTATLADSEEAARAAAWAWYWRLVKVAGALTKHLDAISSTLPDPARAAVWPWPAALAWPDEQVCAVERWLAEVGELPEVLRG